VFHSILLGDFRPIKYWVYA